MLTKYSLLQLDKLVTSQLGFLAQRRLARGVKLNHSEACVCNCSLLFDDHKQNSADISRRS